VTASNFIRALILTAAIAACEGEYVLPVADGGPEPSAPALQGRVVSAAADHLVVATDAPSGIPSTVAFRLGPRTELFTVYGGLVGVKELAAGQRVRVWFAEPGLPRHPEASAAVVVMLASTDPNDDWP
jgi:hypothetical protein